ncbi:ArnT family glycosyltransferase [Phenylobacterium sp.]|uniref:ArnT family glycosyltransferase n=1 Tax=Phenylobacterium sp. TaxID=1871053 RepID=UPI0035B2591C
MSLEDHLDRVSRGWRGPLLAAFVALLAGLPGVFTVPTLDRDEARFAQATAQMLESGDFVVIRYQDQPRFKKPVGIHWLQAASVSLLSEPEARAIWAYRIPSLLGAMLAAAACAWGARAVFGPATGLIAGGLLASTFLLSTEAFIAKTDAVLAGTTTLAMAAMAHIYAAARDGPPAGRLTRLLFWLGLSGATLVKGPVGPMVVVLAALTLWAWDRRGGWLKKLGWGWGPILFAAIVGPWAWAVTVATDGGFWTAAIAGDLAPKLVGGQETHGAPPGYHALLAPLLFFPASLLLPAALIGAWRGRRETGVRFAVAWLVPAWLVFELTPTKLAHYPLPTYAALAWLAAAAARQEPGPIARWSGAAISAFAGFALAAGTFYLLSQYGGGGDVTAAAMTGALMLGAGVAGAYMLLRRSARGAAVAACALGVLGHASLVSVFAPGLGPLWLSEHVEAALAKARLLPRQGIAPGPVAVAGYAEPSLVFALGTTTELDDAQQAAEAVAEHRPAVVEARQQAAFDAAVAARKLSPRLVGVVHGLDYSNGDEMSLNVYAADQDAAAPSQETRP